MTDDLISRQAAIDALIAEGRNVDSRYLESERIIHESDAVEAISLLSPAQLERKRGKWIRHSIGHKNTPWGFDCSVCGKWFVIGEDTAERYHYCPNCGAEMKGEDDGLD